MERSNAMVKMIVLAMMMSGVWWRSASGAATARPLNDSPGELAWAAWLHRDPSDQEAQPPPRRITTKSLFVFPHLGAEALPACADGYRPDSMNRCVKVVKLDESAHLQFLLEKLNSKFGAQNNQEGGDDYDYDQDTETPDSSGPFQLNIPLVQVRPSYFDESEGSGDSVVVFKKDDPSLGSRPTSFPEVLPEYIQSDDRETPDKTDSPAVNKTVTATINGKFENFTCDSCKHEDEAGKNETEIAEKAPIESTTLTVETTTDEITTTIFPVADILTPKNSSSPTDQGLVIIKNQNEINDTKPLVQQIEALKSEHNATLINPPMHQINNKQNETIHLSQSNETDSEKKTSLHNANFDVVSDASESFNIEDKIKVISRFADVVVNDFDLQKKTSLHKNIPETDDSIDVRHRPISSGSIVRFPSESNSYKLSHKRQHIKSRPPLDDYGAYQLEKTPLWWGSQGWNSDGVDKQWSSNRQGQDYPDLWSKHSLRSDYKEANIQHPVQPYPPYPDSHHLGGQLNLRHTTTNHRRGKPLVYKQPRAEYEELFVYARDRHPHYRE